MICLASLAILPCSSIGAITEARLPRSGRSTPTAAGSSTACRASSTRCRSRSGSTSRSRSCRSRPRSRPTRSATSPGARSGASSRSSSRRFLRPLPQLGDRAGRRRSSATSGEPLLDGLKTIFGIGHVGVAARPGRGRRPRRQLPHDHLRVRPEHLLALARGLLPARALGDPREAADAARRARLGAVVGWISAYLIYKSPATSRSAARCSTWRCSAR